MKTNLLPFHIKIKFCSSHLVLAQTERWILELLNGLLIKVAVFLPKLQQLRTREGPAQPLGRATHVGEFDTKSPSAQTEKKMKEKKRGPHPGDLLLLLLFHSQKAGAVDGNHNLLQSCQQILLLLALTAKARRRTSPHAGAARCAARYRSDDMRRLAEREEVPRGFATPVMAGVTASHLCHLYRCSELAC